jgi:hypothetical protein
LIFRVTRGENFFNFIFSWQRQLLLQLLFILKDKYEVENIFHIGSHALTIRLWNIQNTLINNQKLWTIT